MRCEKSSTSTFERFRCFRLMLIISIHPSIIMYTVNRHSSSKGNFSFIRMDIDLIGSILSFGFPLDSLCRKIILLLLLSLLHHHHHHHYFDAFSSAVPPKCANTYLCTYSTFVGVVSTCKHEEKCVFMFEPLIQKPFQCQRQCAPC